MVRTISKMFLKKCFFSLLTSLTTTLHFSRAHHWLLHSFPPLSTCSPHLYFPPLLFAMYIPALWSRYAALGTRFPPLSLVAFFTLTSLATSQFFQRLLYLCHCCSIFPPLSFGLCVPAFLFRFSLLCYIELVVMLSV